ncbi:MAG: glycerophosphodiester phosphodiesterase [Alistipes sp.]|nr:glycerophosphodiester phosphodiesterase [Alistipes sp.]
MKNIITLAACRFAVSTVCAQTQVIAHRGFHAKQGSANNTLSSLRNAQDLGVFGSECDVNETQDGVLVVIHGPMHGSYNVQYTDFATLRAQALDNGESLPTFEEYLTQAEKNTATKLIIEVKDHDTPERETRVVKKVLAAVKKHKLQKHVEYIAFRQFVCDQLVKLGPKGIKVAYLNGTLSPAYCKGLGYTGIDYHIGVMKNHPNWIKQAHDNGLTVNIWTVNDTENLQWCIDNGADYITTDNPLEANRLLGK